jgi:hypothetical protein
VAVEAGHELVVVHACIDNEDADTAKDLAELASEIEVSMEQYVERSPAVELRLHVGDTDPSCLVRSTDGFTSCTGVLARTTSRVGPHSSGHAPVRPA